MNNFKTCKYREGDYCKKISHQITNGFAQKQHCDKCEYYENKILDIDSDDMQKM